MRTHGKAAPVCAPYQRRSHQWVRSFHLLLRHRRLAWLRLLTRRKERSTIDGGGASGREWYRGDICVTLLRDVRAGSETLLGTLPVQVTASGGAFRITNRAGTLRDLWVRVAAPDGVKTLVINGTPAPQIVTGNGWIAARCDLPPGETALSLRAE